jgi:hypothetical protein
MSSLRQDGKRSVACGYVLLETCDLRQRPRLYGARLARQGARARMASCKEVSTYDGKQLAGFHQRVTADWDVSRLRDRFGLSHGS